ncbi:MAG TPA: c-type cytochrome [Pusillimonas sp.]|uniref:c-type cytochrome n=1 Tax=Pusillimonas sp. TaxID=3040095 RepID=UPI002C39F684|nr:c-type cytochrome [Pusillimonas sp.]HUH88758.1 c-type cytochrome [Pusillimonas sp.]
MPPAGQLLHGVTLRPPLLCWNGSAYTGARLTQVNIDEARRTPGVVNVMIRQDFVGAIASQPAQALQACNRLQAGWAMPLASGTAIGSNARPSSLTSPNPVAADAANSDQLYQAYTWPAASAPDMAWAIAQHADSSLTVWVNTRHKDTLRSELAQLCSLQVEQVHIIANGQTQAEGYDVAADAALLALGCGKPVRVQQRPQTSGTEALRIEVSATCSDARSPDNTAAQAQGKVYSPIANLAVSAQQQLARRPSIAALLCGLQVCYAPDVVLRMADYAPQQAQFPTTSDKAGLQEGSVQGLPVSAQVFAQESFFDEACEQQGLDPVHARLQAMGDETGRHLINAVASRAKWFERDRNGRQAYQGKGFAYAHVVDQSRQPPREVWSAWVAEVAVDPATGAINLTGLTVGHDGGQIQTGATRLIQDDVRQAATRWLPNSPSFDDWASNDENHFPLAASSPDVQLVEQGPTGLAWSREAELPAAAAIANAIHDATGIRLREAPFDAEQLKQQLALADSGRRYKRTGYALLGGLAAAVGSLLVAAMPWRAAIAPVASVDTSIYSAAAIERGRLVAAAGDCMVCHTAEGGTPNAGGLALDTPFGTIVTTNITPDKETGIGNWSYAAFERAMRQGIHRDGRHLYPAFPYTAFAKMSDADMQSLYAYLMVQEPVHNQVEPTDLRFPYNVRPLLAGWNLLYHKDETYQPDPAQTTLWNRGAYLVQSMGHCAACHSPRNALGAEKSDKGSFLAGGFAEGWEAPALNALSKAPIPWSEDELYNYLRTGYSPLHGVASGPMAPVIQSMAEMPDQDVRAVAHYLGTLAAAPNEASPAMQAALLEERSRNDQRVLSLAGENLFQGACAVCHDAREGPPLFGARPSLALNTNLHSDHPDNAIQILLHGIDNPAAAELGYMPGFADSMNDEQLQTLLEYLRMRFAPDKPAWEGLEEKIRALRE